MLSLYAGTVAVWIIPFITVPYLARVLGVSGWGRYSFALSFTTQIALLVEYGFGITGSRAISKQRSRPDAAGRTLGAVISAKLILAGIACVIAGLIYRWTPAVREDATLFWLSLSAGITQGAGFGWFLNGIERIALGTSIEAGSRVAGAGASLLIVKSESDIWKLFAFQSVANLLAIAIVLILALQFTAIKRPEPGAVKACLRNGFSATLSRPGFGLFTGLTTFVLGLFAGHELVGKYAGAERIARAAISLSAPIGLALFPRINSLDGHSATLSRVRRVGAMASMLVSVAASVGMFVLAPAVVKLVLGGGYEDSATILRILSPLPILVGINQVVLYQYLLPAGAWDFAAFSLAGTSTVILVLAITWGLGGSAPVIAGATLIAEIVASCCFLWRLNSSAALPARP